MILLTLFLSVAVAETVIDVRNHGAKGDDVTDDTAAIQTAIDLAQSGGAAATVYLPSGKYRINASLLVSSTPPITIRGEGPGRSFIKTSLPITAIRRRDSRTGNYFRYEGFHIWFEAKAMGSGRGLDLSFHSASIVENIAVTFQSPGVGATGNGVGFYGNDPLLAGSSPYYNRLDSIRVGCGGIAGTVGIWLDSTKMDTGSRGANANRVTGGHIAACDVGMRVFGHGNTISNLVMESIRSRHYEIGTDEFISGFNNEVMGGYHEGNSGSFLVRFGRHARGNRVEPSKVTSIGGVSHELEVLPGEALHEVLNVRTNQLVVNQRVTGDLRLRGTSATAWGNLKASPTAVRNWTLPDRSGAIPLSAEPQPDSRATNLEELKGDLNLLLKRLRDSGVIKR